jgi:DNA-directed RNA polymerase subunit RPC12/RpoP
MAKGTAEIIDSTVELPMPTRRKLNLEKIEKSMNVACPHCAVRIEPKDYKRVDWEHLECPSCGAKFIPAAKSEGAGS